MSNLLQRHHRTGPRQRDLLPSSTKRRWRTQEAKDPRRDNHSIDGVTAAGGRLPYILGDRVGAKNILVLGFQALAVVSILFLRLKVRCLLRSRRDIGFICRRHAAKCSIGSENFL